MLRFEKMTVKAQEAVQGAQEVAAQHENQQIEPIHLLAALVRPGRGDPGYNLQQQRQRGAALRDWLRRVRLRGHGKCLQPASPQSFDRIALLYRALAISRPAAEYLC